MIKAKVEEEALKTHEFIKYVLGKFVEHFPLSEKEVIELEIYEGRDPFPKIKEVSESYPVEKVIIESATDVKAHIAERARAMSVWLPKRFAGLCTISSSDGWHGERLRANLKFFVVSPEKIEAEYKKLGGGVKDTEGINSSKPDDEQTQDMTILCLDSEGTLYVKNDPSRRYEVKQDSNRHKIVNFLSRNSSYQKTSDIARECGLNDEQETSNIISGINKTARSYLKTGRENLIVARRGSGYKINPKLPILRE